MDRSNIVKQLAGLSAAERMLLESRLRDRGLMSGATNSIPKGVDRDCFALSFAQQRLWFLDQLEPGGCVYNLPYAWRLTGTLDVGALRHALDAIVARHEALRTYFILQGDAPVQVIRNDQPVELPLVDLSDAVADEREAELGRRLYEEGRQPFDLAQGPMLRARLFRLGQYDHVLSCTMHHIATDGWSLAIFYDELATFYNSYCSHTPVNLPELAIQYADYAVWQRQHLLGEVFEHQLAYWKAQLKGTHGLLDLPLDRPRPPVQSYVGARRSVLLQKSLVEGLRALSQRHHGTMFMTMLAAWQALLCRYTHQTDIVIGVPTAGRKHLETEKLIGFFVNTLALRTDLSGDPTFSELLGRVSKIALEAYQNDELPFEKLVEEFNLERNLSYSPFFQTMFAFQNLPKSTGEISGLKVTRIAVDPKIAKFDLTLFVMTSDDALEATIEYNSDLFDASTVERMLGHYQTLLEGIVADPEQRISELPLLTPAEKHQLLVEWNDTKTDHPKDKCIHELFEAQVEKTPDAIAVAFEDRQISYRELNGRANQLAHYLRKLGVGPDVLVGICLERSIEMIIGLLAILKAGGAYVPLDPAYPSERLALMVADSRAATLVSQQQLSDMLDNSTVTMIALDTDSDKISREDDTNLAVKVSTEHLAYVLYTSGSTGVPKGVEVKHRNTLAFISWALAAFDREDFDGVLAATSICFDLSVFEIFATLSCGGKILLVNNALALARLRPAGEVTLINTVPSAIAELLKLRAIPPSIRVINLAGETLPTTLVQLIYQSTSVDRVNDLYGPTECTTYSTWTCRQPDGRQTIGRPIANTTIFILDPHLMPVPIGIPGEIFIGGDGLARGYLNRPELTAEKFIANPFSKDPASRLYKTGDLARYLPDGNIEFLGRIDNQVKIRGFRIELGEIEAVLAQHPAIQQAVVLAREDTPGNRRLVAYVVASSGCTAAAHELRSYLQHKLPEYMVPSILISLDSLPLTANGKLDRKALPPPDHGRAEFEDTYVAPTTPTEEILANIWSEVLKLDKVGIHDNFFHLGGHSLLATQVVSRIRNAFKLDLPLRDLFETPTIAGLADWLQASRGIDKDSQTTQTIVALPRSNDMPLSFAQERLWFLDHLDPDSPTYNIPAAFRLSGDLNLNALELSLNEVVRRHEVLRTVFASGDGKPMQHILPSLVLSLTPIDLNEQPESERESALQSLLENEALRPFDLSRGPLIRARIWRLAPHNHVLAFTMHHIVSDGWSLGVMFQELSVLYQALSTGKPSPLPELQIQYADYAVWQREWLVGAELQRQLAYWKNQLDSLSTLQLPTDRPRPARQTYRGARRSAELPAQLCQTLKSISQREGVTLFMTLLAAFQVLLSRYSGQSDFAVGSPIAGRTRQEAEKLIGFFVNTLVLRADLSEDPTFNELLAQVRETTLQAYSHQDLPFEKLVEVLHPERDTGISPLFQVMFSLQNIDNQPLDIKDLAVSAIQTDNRVAKFDLSLTVSEKNGATRASLNYNTDLFDAPTIERMLGHFQILLEGIVADPEQRISNLPLLTETEKHQLLIEWNDTKTDYPNQCMHELFETQVESSPEAIAVVCEDQQITYRELNSRANQLAHHLQRLGVGPEVLVGICLERSIEMIVGLLAILKAGGAYVPLDPDYPNERLRFMIEDAQVRLVLTQRRHSERLTCQSIQILSVDMNQEQIDQESDLNLPSLVKSRHLAYVIYTSGTTGTPKGVMIEHRSLVNYLHWFNQSPLAQITQVIPLITKASFDASLKQLFAPLLGSRQVWVPAAETINEPVALLDALTTQKHVGLNCVPSLWRALLDELTPGRADAVTNSLSALFLGGEQLDRQLIDRTYNAIPETKIWNLYGPTEATANVCVGSVMPHNPLTIGRPIANTQLYILDRHLQPSPIGVPGELHIGGDSLARGYLNRPELTGEKFIANPFSNDPASRLYKTGDLARYLPHGNIEFLGRIDNQVKIRGFRIELGEIEAVLAQHPAIQQAVVLAKEDTPGDRRLVAYTVANQSSNPSADELRSFLQQKLPDYMVPSIFISLESLPLTANGKLDRKALPAPDHSRAEFEDTYVAPNTPAEEILAGIWSEVLKLDKVGIHDNFFHLGGHSLLATQVVSRIREAFKLDLPLRTLFEAPTIQGLAQRLQNLADNPTATPTAQIAPVSRQQYRIKPTK